MLPCNKCKTNAWTATQCSAFIVMICLNCGYEVEIKPKGKIKRLPKYLEFKQRLNHKNGES